MTAEIPRPNMQDISDKTVLDFQIEAEARFEEGVVEYLLKRYNRSSKSKWHMINRHEELYGFKRLTLAAFHELYPTFPVRLYAAKFEKFDDNAHAHRLWEKFESRKFFTRLEELEDERGEEDLTEIALVFFWPYLKQSPTKEGGALVLHRRFLLPELAEGTSMTYTTEGGAVYVLEPLHRFLECLDTASWFDMEECW